MSSVEVVTVDFTVNAGNLVGNNSTIAFYVYEHSRMSIGLELVPGFCFGLRNATGISQLVKVDTGSMLVFYIGLYGLDAEMDGNAVADNFVEVRRNSTMYIYDTPYLHVADLLFGAAISTLTAIIYQDLSLTDRTLFFVDGTSSLDYPLPYYYTGGVPTGPFSCNLQMRHFKKIFYADGGSISSGSLKPYKSNSESDSVFAQSDNGGLIKLNLVNGVGQDNTTSWYRMLQASSGSAIACDLTEYVFIFVIAPAPIDYYQDNAATHSMILAENQSKIELYSESTTNDRMLETGNNNSIHMETSESSSIVWHYSDEDLYFDGLANEPVVENGDSGNLTGLDYFYLSDGTKMGQGCYISQRQSGENVLEDPYLEYCFPSCTHTHEHEYPVDIKTITSDYTIEPEYELILCNASSTDITVTMPAVASENGSRYYIKRIDDSANSVTVDGHGSETIDGQYTQSLSHRDCILVVCDGTSWHII